MPKELRMSETFVLITGAWHGGWAWRPVAEHLRAAGHRVLTPTLPGLHDGDDPTGYHLSDVVDAVVELVEREELRDVTLVGHSWGGYPVTGAAPRLVGRLRKVVYWSAFVPAAGKSLFDEVPPPSQELFGGLAAASGNNSVALPLDVAALGVPVAYVLSSEDVALPPGEYGWDQFPCRIGVTPLSAPAATRPASPSPPVWPKPY
jgi:pimeloyl-ACP methyl ester carboxylesterase